MSFLLESVEGGAVRGRYSIIGVEPDLIWRADGAKAEINRSARTKADAFVACTEPPLQALRALISESRIELPNSLPPMAAGVFGYLGYDIVRRWRNWQPNPDPIGIPDAVLVRPTIIVVFDAVKDSITIVTPVRPEKNVDAKAALARAVERLARVVESLDRPLDKSLSEQNTGPARCPGEIKHDTRRISRRWCARQRNTSPQAMRSKSCWRNASRRRLRCHRSRSIARCGGQIRRLICISSTLAILPSRDRVRKFLSRFRETSSPSARSPAPARAARRRMRTRRWKRNCSPIRKSAPSI